MRNQVFKKLFSVLLALIMVAGLLPASAMAGGWGAMDVDTTPELTETEQPAEPTPEQGEPVAEPTPEQGEPTAEPVPTQGEPTAEPTDEGIMPANVMPVQANVAARDTSGDDYYRIVHLDCGRKYFDVNYIKGIIDTMYLNGYNQLQLAFGNGGLRFVLDGMSQDLKDAIVEGNENFYPNSGQKSVLTESEMTEIIRYANGKKIEIVPLLNMPGHMDGILSTSTYSKYRLKGTVDGKEKYDGSLDLNNTDAVAFGKELLSMYVEYFKTQGCKFFNFGADEYGQGIRNPYIESSVAQVDYKQLIDYMNACAEIIENAGMTARCFNDFVCYNNRTSCDLKKRVQVCYWSNQWNGSEYNTVDVINNAGYKLINTNQKWYFVPSKADEYSKTTVLANFKTFDVTKFQNIKSEWNSTSTTYSEIIGGNNVGAMFCVWCDTPSVAVDLSDVKELIAAMADANPTYFTKVTIPNTTVGNATTADNDTVRVTGPNLAALKCETTTVTIQGAAEGKIAAYNVTPSTADSKYTEKAEVRIKIPAEWDKTKVKAFIVEDGTAKDIADGKVDGEWYVFTAPHFSVMGIYEKAATTEVGGTIEIVAGQTGVITVNGVVTSDKIGSPVNAGIAAVAEDGIATTPGETTTAEITSTNDLKEGNKYLIYNTRYNNTLTNQESTWYDYYYYKGLKLNGSVTTDNGNWWKIKSVNGGYTVDYNAGSKFLTIGYNTASLGSSSAILSLLYNETGKYWNISQNSYYLNNLGGTETAGGWKDNAAPTDAGSRWQIHEIRQTGDKTTITIKGIAAGTTTIVIDGKTYTIKVVDATLENAEKLYIDFWVTNHRIYPTNLNVVTTTSNNKQNARTYYEFSAADFYEAGEEGRVLTDVIPQTGNYESTTGTEALYWKTRYLPNAHRQTEAGWTNKSGYGTDTVTGANGGVDIERIRFYGGKWEYRAVDATDWNKLSGTTADENGNQIVAYYMLKTTVTDEVTTYITDWPDNQTDEFYGVAVDYCVKYESDGVRNPDKFGRAQNSNTQWLNCDGTNNGSAHNNGYSVLASNVTTDWKGLRTNTSGNDWYRVINNIRAVETAEYEIYMVTVTPSESFSLQNQQCPENITYNEQYEKVIWAESQDTIAASGLAQHSEAKIGGEPNIDKLVIQQCSGMLVTYYVRAKASEDSLTVNYYVDGSQTPFHTYNIAVPKNTTFSKEFALTEQGGLINNTVINIKGKTETVQWDLKLMPQIGAQYRYTQYKLVRVAKVTEEVPKTVNLYYTFNATKTFVVDFGLPLRIEPKDLNENLGAVDVNITKTEVGKVSSFAEVIPGENGVITYKLTEMISDKDTFGVKYTGTLVMSDNTLQSGTVEYTVTIIPATNVYYEDSFAKFYGSDGKQQTVFNQTSAGDVAGTWYAAKDTSAENNANTTQALEALGNKTNVYGYDPKYDSCTMFSMGSARKVNVTSDMAKDGVVWPTAQFTFKGTGFDIISLTDNTSGAIFVDVTRKVNGEEVKERSVFVDNYYGYSYENGTWKAEPNNPNAIYQVPVIKVSGLDYDEYKVVIKVAYNTFFDDANAGSYSFWLDAVRVYDPAGNTLDNDYVKDREVKPIYVEVRKALIGQDGFTPNGSGLTNGAVFIDGKSTGASIDDYKNFGPNHEVYLARDQAIAFRIVADRIPATVQIGVKLANGSSGELTLSGSNAKFAAYGDADENAKLTLNTATNMYYALNGITWTQEENGSQKSNVIVLTNTGDNSIVSITNVKCTYASITENTTNTVTLAISYDDALMAVDAVNNAITPVEPEPEPEPEPEKTFEPERFEASWSRNVMQGRKSTLTVKTSEDVEAITVDGQTIRSYRTRTERMGFGRRAKRITYREFTYSMVAQESADFSVTAINAEGTESEAITARLTVKTRPNSMRDMWDWFKGWF